MFPFGAISTLKGISDDLKLTMLIVSDLALSGDAWAGCKLDSDGDLKDSTNGTTWNVRHTNEWIMSEYHDSPAFDPNDYEGGYFNVTGTGLVQGSAEDTYISLHLAPYWFLRIPPTYPEFAWCTGTLKVREKANPSNEVTATLSLDVEVS